MISLPQFPDAKCLTHSQIGTFRSCQRKEHYGYVLGVRPQFASSALRFGTNVHHGIELRAKGASVDDAVLGAMQQYDNVPGNMRHDEALMEREIVGRMLAGYFWWWERENEVPPALFVHTNLAAEQQFKLKIKGSSFWYAGKIDGIVQLGDGRVAVRETKTSSDDITPSSDYVRRLLIDNQISGYMVAARKKYPAQTVLYDIVKKPTIKPYKATPVDKRKYTKDGLLYANMRDTDETPEQFGERLTASIAENPADYYQRYEIPRLDHDLEAWEKEMSDTAKQIATARKKGYTARNTNTCLDGYRCQYLDVCHSGIVIGGDVPSGFRQATRAHEELE